MFNQWTAINCTVCRREHYYAASVYLTYGRLLVWLFIFELCRQKRKQRRSKSRCTHRRSNFLQNPFGMDTLHIRRRGVPGKRVFSGLATGPEHEPSDLHNIIIIMLWQDTERIGKAKTTSKDSNHHYSLYDATVISCPTTTISNTVVSRTTVLRSLDHPPRPAQGVSVFSVNRLVESYDWGIRTPGLTNHEPNERLKGSYYPMYTDLT